MVNGYLPDRPWLRWPITSRRLDSFRTIPTDYVWATFNPPSDTLDTPVFCTGKNKTGHLW